MMAASSNEGSPENTVSGGGGSATSNVIVVDKNRLRRCFLKNTLSSWLTTAGIRCVDYSPESLPKENNPIKTYRLCVINFGSSSVSETRSQALLDQVLSTFEGVPIVIVSDRDAPEEVRSAFRAGAKAFVPTTLDPKLTARLITFVIEGGTYYPPSAILAQSGGSADVKGAQSDLQTKCVSGTTESKSTADVDLTERQQDVVLLLQEGLPNKVIARHLGMTEATVKVHVRQIMRRLGVKNRTQIALRMAALAADANKNHGRPEIVKVRAASGANVVRN